MKRKLITDEYNRQMQQLDSLLENIHLKLDRVMHGVAVKQDVIETELRSEDCVNVTVDECLTE